jgi:hypothetical protein
MICCNSSPSLELDALAVEPQVERRVPVGSSITVIANRFIYFERMPDVSFTKLPFS